MTTIIHVYRQRIAQNRKLSTDEAHAPPIIVRNGKSRRYGNSVEIHGSSRIVYNPNNPLDCGAQVWIETHSPVTIHD